MNTRQQLDRLISDLRGIGDDLREHDSESYNLAIIRSNLQFAIEQAEALAKAEQGATA